MLLIVSGLARRKRRRAAAATSRSRVGGTHAQTFLATAIAVGLSDGTNDFVVGVRDGELSVVGGLGRHCCAPVSGHAVRMQGIEWRIAPESFGEAVKHKDGRKGAGE